MYQWLFERATDCLEIHKGVLFKGVLFKGVLLKGVLFKGVLFKGVLFRHNTFNVTQQCASTDSFITDV